MRRNKLKQTLPYLCLPRNKLIYFPILPLVVMCDYNSRNLFLAVFWTKRSGLCFGLNNKPMALTQCCSAKTWKTKGITLLQDILIENHLGSWDDLKNNYQFLFSHMKTYTLICKVVGSFFLGRIYSFAQFIDQVKWIDGKF